MLPEIKHISGDGFELWLTADPFNKRVRLDDYRGNTRKALEAAEMFTRSVNAEKWIVKARREDFQTLAEYGLQYEAGIDRFYLGSDCCFFAAYYTSTRRSSAAWEKGDRILREARQAAGGGSGIPEGYCFRKAEKQDAAELARLYGSIFELYPVPLNEEAYIHSAMEKGGRFYVCTLGDRIVSAASAEVDLFYKNAEITDCATLPEHRKHGLMKEIISALEKDLHNDGIFCLYSIARALSFGMNAAFHGLGYKYRGRLANNCYIMDKLEDMNVWVKNG